MRQLGTIETIFLEGLAMRAVQALEPGHEERDYMDGDPAWFTGAMTKSREIPVGILPELEKSYSTTVTRFTYGASAFAGIRLTLPRLALAYRVSAGHEVAQSQEPRQRVPFAVSRESSISSQELNIAAAAMRGWGLVSAKWVMSYVSLLNLLAADCLVLNNTSLQPERRLGRKCTVTDTV